MGPGLTHDTDTNVTRRGTTRLRRAPAEKDQPADPSHPEQWVQATAPTRNTVHHAVGFRIANNNPPPPTTDSDQPPPEVWCTVLERRHYYLVSPAAASPGPKWVIKGTDIMHRALGATPPRAIGEPATPH